MTDRLQLYINRKNAEAEVGYRPIAAAATLGEEWLNDSESLADIDRSRIFREADSHTLSRQPLGRQSRFVQIRLFQMLLRFMIFAAACVVTPAHAAESAHLPFVSVGDVYQMLREEAAPTSEQRAYFRAVAQTASWMNYVAWGSNGRGLFCFGDDVMIGEDALIDLVKRQVDEDRTRYHDTRLPAATVAAIGLMQKHPCTQEDVQDYQNDLFHAQPRIKEAIQP